MTPEAISGYKAQARLLNLDRGLYSIAVLLRAPQADDAYPRICLAVPPGPGGAANDVGLAGAAPGWHALPASGHVAFADVRSARGLVLLGTSGTSESDAFEVVVARLNCAAAQPRHYEGVCAKLKLRIERLGWRRFTGAGWARSRNRHLRILEIALDADTASPPLPIELEAFASDHRRTGWLAAGEVASFPGADTPLTGFAARLAESNSRSDLSVGYSGEFREGGTIGACFDGRPCRSPISDDPLVGLILWIGRRPA